MWPFETLYIGPIHARGGVIYASPVLCVSLGKSFKYRVGKGPWVDSICTATPAGIYHEVRTTANTIIAKYWVEGESDHFESLTQFSAMFEYSNYPNQQKIISAFRDILDRSSGSADTKTKLDLALHHETSGCNKTDPRVIHLSKLLRNEPDNNFSIEQLANKVDLSPSRLLHLIKQETGVAYRRFRMWHRVRYALSIYGNQNSITHSSVDAGFSDSAHFSRCFSSFYGTTPSSVLKSLEMYEIACSE
jgi:AraC-like DNA-binding protein